jgi:regulator of replication initiation timing
MYKMLEENTLLIKENEKLRDADHHQQMASGKKMLQS